MPAWVLNPLHQVFAGLALGAALAGLAAGGRRWIAAAGTLCIAAAWLAANGLTQNLAIAPARAVLSIQLIGRGLLSIEVGQCPSGYAK